MRQNAFGPRIQEGVRELSVRAVKNHGKASPLPFNKGNDQPVGNKHQDYGGICFCYVEFPGLTPTQQHDLFS